MGLSKKIGHIEQSVMIENGQIKTSRKDLDQT